MQAGLLEALQGAWRALVVQDALALETLHLLGALLANSFDARHALCAVGQQPLLIRIIRVIFRCALLAYSISERMCLTALPKGIQRVYPHAPTARHKYRQGTTPALQQAACQVVTNLATSLDGTLALLKAPFATSACKTLRAAAIRGDERDAAPVATVALLRALAAMAAHGEAQRQLVRGDGGASGGPALLDVALELLSATRQPTVVAAAVMVLRNVAFRPDNKSHFLADPRCACRQNVSAPDCSCMLCFLATQSPASARCSH